MRESRPSLDCPPAARRMAEATHRALEAALVAWSREAAAGGFTMRQVGTYRTVFASWVEALRDDLVITPDDAAVFREVRRAGGRGDCASIHPLSRNTLSQVAPLFEPHYVTYDADPTAYEALPRVYARILGQ